MKKLKDLVHRPKCVLSGREDLEHLYTFKDFPVFMGTTDRQVADDEVADMAWFIGPHMGTVQLNPLIPLSILYADSHGSGSVGKLWDLHHEGFANFVHKFAPKAVLELGGGHGVLAQKYKKVARVPWTILEPNPTPVEDCPARFIKGFFDDNFVFNEEFDAVIHSHVLEHIYEPNEFMEHLSTFMAEGKKLIFSLPNMRVMLERNYTNCLNFEHTVLLTEYEVEYLLSRHGFRLMEKKYFMDDHSIFYCAVRDSTVDEDPLPKNLYQRNKELFLGYIDYHKALIQDLNKRAQQCSGPVYLFGAHIFTQYLISFGLDTSKIVGILDNDPHKQGMRLSGTHLTVESPKALKGKVAPAVILKAGVYNDEIKSDILGNINPAAEFLE